MNTKSVLVIVFLWALNAASDPGVLWKSPYPGQGMELYIDHIVPTPDGGLLVFDWSGRFCRFSSNGDSLWCVNCLFRDFLPSSVCLSDEEKVVLLRSSLGPPLAGLEHLRSPTKADADSVKNWITIASIGADEGRILIDRVFSRDYYGRPVRVVAADSTFYGLYVKDGDSAYQGGPQWPGPGSTITVVRLNRSGGLVWKSQSYITTRVADVPQGNLFTFAISNSQPKCLVFGIEFEVNEVQQNPNDRRREYNRNPHLSDSLTYFVGTVIRASGGCLIDTVLHPGDLHEYLNDGIYKIQMFNNMYIHNWLEIDEGSVRLIRLEGIGRTKSVGSGSETFTNKFSFYDLRTDIWSERSFGKVRDSTNYELVDFYPSYLFRTRDKRYLIFGNAGNYLEIDMGSRDKVVSHDAFACERVGGGVFTLTLESHNRLGIENCVYTDGSLFIATEVDEVQVEPFQHIHQVWLTKIGPVE